MHYGYIGLGNLGAACAGCLLRGGFGNYLGRFIQPRQFNPTEPLLDLTFGKCV